MKVMILVGVISTVIAAAIIGCFKIIVENKKIKNVLNYFKTIFEYHKRIKIGKINRNDYKKIENKILRNRKISKREAELYKKYKIEVLNAKNTMDKHKEQIKAFINYNRF